MAVTATPVFVQTPKVGLVQILNADASANKTVVTGGTNGTKVTSLTLASTDTSARVVNVNIVRSGTTYNLGAVSVPITAGTDGATLTINCFSPLVIPGLPVDNDGQPYLFLQSSDTLSVSAATTVTSGKIISAVAVSGDF